MAMDKEWYDLSDLEAVRTWNYTAPTLVKAGRFTNRKAWIEASSFWDEFTKQFPLFEHVDIDGMAIFGGAVQDLLIDTSPNDIDICFFHEGTPHESGIALKNRVERFLNDIFDFISKNNKEYKGLPSNEKRDRSQYNISKILVTRFRNCYEIKLNNSLCSPTIQITHKPNITALFDHIDIPCTAICYYDAKIMMHEKAKFALESSVIELNVNTQNTPKKYTSRLMKYFNKGYDIILRDLNMDKLDRRNLPFGLREVLDLPYFTVIYSGITNNKIEVYNIKELEDEEEEVQVIRRFGGYASVGTMGVGEIIHKNVKSLVNGKFDEFVSIGQGETFKTVFNPDVVITERMITNCFQKVMKRVNGRALNLGDIEQYFTCRGMDRVMQEVIVDFACKGLSYNSEEYMDHVKRYFEDLTAEQIQAAKDRVLECKGKGSLDIIMDTVDVKEEATAKKEFYGNYCIIAI